MKNSLFNLNTFMHKKAFYEDARGYMNSQSRAFMNCYKCKSDEGKTPSEAWTECQKEFQDSSKSGEFGMKYSTDSESTKTPYPDQKTPFVQEEIK